jgi:nitrite reductase (NO-forming)
MKKAAVCALAIVSIILVCTAFFQEYDLSKSIERGKEVYIANCMNCHLAEGTATPNQYPPLAKADYLLKPADTLITIILEGQTGEVVVNGEKYNDQMLAQDYLSDAQIADVLNYVRNSWGNKMAAIIPQQVKVLRK